MSVPGAFPPVKVDGNLLIDGFLVENVPVQIAKDWGADIIIAVDVGAGLMKEDELKTLLDMTNQMIGILSQRNVDESLKLLTDKDLLINPNMPGIGPGDFVKTPEASIKGREAALKHLEKIKTYSVSDSEYQVFLANQRVRDRSPIMIDFVQVNKPKRVNEAMIKGRIKTKAGQPINFDQLDRDLTNIYAIGDFETVGFNIKEKDGKKGLVINTKEKDWGPEYIRFGLNSYSDLGGTNNFTSVLDYRHTQLNSLGGEWKVVGEFGQNSGFSTEFYQPLDPQNYFFVMPQLFYKKNYRDLYDDNDNRVTQYKRTDAGGGFDIGVNLKTYLEARVGLRYDSITGKPEIGNPDLPEFEDVKDVGVLAQVDFDQFDDHRFPTSGFKAASKLFFSEESLGSDKDYQKLDVLLGKATTFDKRHTVLAMVKGGMSLDNDTPFYNNFSLGGFLNMSGLAPGQLRGNNMGVAELVYYYNLFETKGLFNKVYLGGSLESGNVWADKSDWGEDPIFGGSAFIGLDTILGPLYIGCGQAESHPTQGFVYLGKTF